MSEKKIKAREQSLLPNSSLGVEFNWDNETYYCGPVVIGFTGLSGTGKTTQATKLGILLNVGVEKGGGHFRAVYESTTGEKALRFIPRSTDADREYDMALMERAHEAKVNGEISIIEARLSGVDIAEQMIREMEIAQETPRAIYDVKACCILLRGHVDNRMKNVARRSYEEGHRVGRKDLKKLTQDRDIKDIQRWQGLYPRLLGKNSPYEESIKDRNGNKIYIIVVDIDGRSEDQVHQEIVKQMIGEGVFVKASTTPPQSLLDPAS